MFGRILIALALLVGLCVLVNTVPGQQPGDIPAPVVDTDVSETGLLSASITCPPSVEACSVLVLDVSGSSAGERRLVFRPSVPEAAIQHDSGGETIYVWIKRPGSYGVLWSVTNDAGEAGDGAGFVVTPRGEGPPDDDPDDPPTPEDTAFLAYIRSETQKVEAANHDDIAGMFRALATRITAGELRGSKAIQTATKRTLFGAPPEMNDEWGDWYNAVFPHMLNVVKLDSDGEWARHYRLVARSLGDE